MFDPSIRHEPKRKLRMKRKEVLITLVCILFAAPIGLAVAGNNGPAVIKIDVNKSGKAVKKFPHKKHQSGTKCKSCHHKSKAGATPKKCGACHTNVKDPDPKTGAPGFKKAFHKQCQGCHKKKTDKPELKKCETCHG
jgi:hypothetical protein